MTSIYVLGVVFVGVIATVITGVIILTTVINAKSNWTPESRRIARAVMLWAAFMVVLILGTLFFDVFATKVVQNPTLYLTILTLLYVAGLIWAYRRCNCLIMAMLWFAATMATKVVWPGLFRTICMGGFYLWVIVVVTSLLDKMVDEIYDVPSMMEEKPKKGGDKVSAQQLSSSCQTTGRWSGSGCDGCPIDVLNGIIDATADIVENV